ncbi:MATE family efflux transporter [candidate division CSSED10-310 bacterium]|uniref:Multidrug-efflux transporter n=1 Tax=candidate division CSSED10-310 bacterium TaxID=2855610 RepID=A0ABV6Z683_UNCC1
MDAATDNPIVTGDIRNQVFRLAWPTMLAMVLETLFSLIDAFWVGKLGADALAAVSGSSFILWTVFSVCQVSAVGLTALVARHIGADNRNLAIEASVQGIILSILMGLVVGLMGLFAMPGLFKLMALSTNVNSLATQYLRIYLGGIFIAFVYIALESIFRASGDTRTPMMILAGALVFNAILDPILIFGYLGLPALGVRGAAWATLIAYFTATLTISILLIKRNLLPRIRSKHWLTIKGHIIWTIIKIGSPVAISGVSFSFVYILLTRVITHFGTAPLAALGMGHRLESIAYLASVGFSIAASTLVGQNLGAQQYDRAARAAWVSTFYASITMGIFSLFVTLFAPQIISLFIKDQEVILIGSQYLFIIACCEVFLAFEIVLEGSFSGAGDTMPPMLVSIPLTVLRLPAAYFLAITMNGGILAIWWVISISTLLKGIVMAIWFHRGAWKRKQLISSP